MSTEDYQEDTKTKKYIHEHKSYTARHVFLAEVMDYIFKFASCFYDPKSLNPDTEVMRF